MVMASGKKWKIRRSATTLKDTTSSTKRMATANSLGKVETSTMATIEMTRGMDTERCIGLMDQFIKGSG
jgi:hypothetical protein